MQYVISFKLPLGMHLKDAFVCACPDKLWEALAEIEMPVGAVEQIKTLMIDRMHSGNQRIEVVIPLYYRVGSGGIEVYGISQEVPPSAKRKSTT